MRCTDEEKARLIVELYIALYIIVYIYMCIRVYDMTTEVPEGPGLDRRPGATMVYTWPGAD